VNKIDSRLEEELEAMSHSALLSYRAQLVPSKSEIKGEFKGEIKTATDINILLKKYETVVRTASNRNLRENNSEEQVDTAHTHTATN